MTNEVIDDKSKVSDGATEKPKDPEPEKSKTVDPESEKSKTDEPSKQSADSTEKNATSSEDEAEFEAQKMDGVHNRIKNSITQNKIK